MRLGFVDVLYCRVAPFCTAGESRNKIRGRTVKKLWDFQGKILSSGNCNITQNPPNFNTKSDSAIKIPLFPLDCCLSFSSFSLTLLFSSPSGHSIIWPTPNPLLPFKRAYTPPALDSPFLLVYLYSSCTGSRSRCFSSFPFPWISGLAVTGVCEILNKFPYLSKFQ
ncbi:hypothetical protein BC828DRAFT_65634 [Blastocladiella britannica]|nr:hypothetical protein BC828DRAFT_65634 [Blastocladiella britannica]